MAKILFAAYVALGGLNGRVSQKKLDLLQFAASGVTQTGAGATKIVRRNRNNPYPDQLGSLNGVPWSGEVYCDHNPYLRTRLVDNIRVEGDAGGERLLWDERARPRVPTLESDAKQS